MLLPWKLGFSLSPSQFEEVVYLMREISSVGRWLQAYSTKKAPGSEPLESVHLHFQPVSDPSPLPPLILTLREQAVSVFLVFINEQTVPPIKASPPPPPPPSSWLFEGGRSSQLVKRLQP